MKLFVLLLASSLVSIPIYAQSAPNPLSAGEKGFHNYIKDNLVAAAEKMPEENYSFKPTPEVRSFGQIVGHLADSQYFFCSSAAGDTKPPGGIEKSKTSKTELVSALKEAVAYCSKTYAGMTDAKGSEMTKMMNLDFAKLTVLSANTAHDYEHYGNMVTYMRLKGIVPPTSEKKGDTGQK